ncbi:MAG: hypothetical protein ABFS08_09465 [Pseudomonadota bacterium]
MKLTNILFPPQARDFTGLRWLTISLRSLHLVGMAGMAGGYLYQASLSALLPFWEITLYSGLAMVGLGIWSNGRWLLQLRGAVILFKLLLLWSLPLLDEVFADGGGWGFVVIILLSSVISHAPGSMRYRFVVQLAGVRAL